MLASVSSATLVGLHGRVIRVEVDVAPGLPGLTIVGLADAALQEARERVRGAIRNAGLVFPPRRITVNLAPADLRKAGSSLDLAIAVGILLGSEQVRAGAARPALVGELSLGGEVRTVPGILPMVAALERSGVARVVVAADAADEAGLVPRIDVVAAATLAEAVAAVAAGRRRRPLVARERVDIGTSAISPAGAGTASAMATAGVAPGPERVPDLAEVRGQAEARRALEIALAGGHGLLLVGPPGSGKTLLARTIPGLLPPLGDADALSATIVRSVAGLGPIRDLVRTAPFRAPHHTASYAAMIGGGARLAPGEVTLADHGVLFLDEFPEFARDVREALRQPLEDGWVTVARVGRAAAFPARFQLVAAMNPCPCGWAGSPDRPCHCPRPVVERYVGRISGPLRDRIDLWVEMPRVPPAAIVDASTPEASAEVRARIAVARGRQAGRAAGVLNARIPGPALRRSARLTDVARARLVELADRERSTGRGTERMLRVARTIADLAAEDAVGVAHLEEAARFRSPAERALEALAG